MNGPIADLANHAREHTTPVADCDWCPLPTAADQPTTEPSAERDAIVEAVIRGQRRARTYSSQRIGSLRGGASEQELTTWRETWPHRPEREFIDEELDRLAPAPQPAADTERLREALANADKHHHEYGAQWIVALADEVKRLRALDWVDG